MFYFYKRSLICTKLMLNCIIFDIIDTKTIKLERQLDVEQQILKITFFASVSSA